MLAMASSTSELQATPSTALSSHTHMRSREAPSPPLEQAADMENDTNPTSLSYDSRDPPEPRDPRDPRDNHVSPTAKNCDRRRPEEEHSHLSHVPTQLVGKTVTPFLKQHIPGLYAPIGKQGSSSAMSREKDPNSKYCYRHHPDSRCRKAADESKMDMIQSELDQLPSEDRQAISHVWSLFSAAPAKHRDLMLQGIITQCCFPQLSTVSREVQDQLKIDFLTALPTEVSYRILGLLDTTSLCKAAQVSRRWRLLADDDVIWHRMCEQHIDKKCRKCGWGLPLLERKRLSGWTKQKKAHKQTHINGETQNNRNPKGPPSPPDSQSSAAKRSASHDIEKKSPRSKRQCISSVSGELMTYKTKAQLEEERQFRPWKDVYRDRFKIGYNWKHGRCSIKTFTGHQNGVTCLQFDHKHLVTGSYDTTIKVWDIETGEVLRTLQGHTMGIRSLHFQDNILVSGGLDGTVRTWDWHTGELLRTVQAHNDGVIGVHFEKGYSASASIDCTVRVFSDKPAQSWLFKGHTDWVNHVRIDTDAKVVFSASDDCTVKLWDLESRECIKTLTGHVGQVQQLLLMPTDFEPEFDEPDKCGETGSVTSGRGGTPNPTCGSSGNEGGEQTASDNFAMCDANNANATTQDPDSSSRRRRESDAADRSAYGSHFANTDRPLPTRYVLTSSLDNTTRLWDTATGQCLNTFFGHLEGIWGLAGDTLRAVTGANDCMVKVWDPRTGKCERTFTGHTGPVTCVGLSDSCMASGSEDGDVRFYRFDGNWIEEAGTPS